MKRIALFVLIFLSAALSMTAQTVSPPRGFVGKLWSSTFALYGTEGKVSHFLCTASPIAKIDGGYRLLTAGHCVQDVPADVQFSVVDTATKKATPITLVKAHMGDAKDTIDFAIFDLKTQKKYFVPVMAKHLTLRIGEPTVNVHFALELGEQLSRGVVSSGPIPDTDNCDEGGCLSNFLVQEYAGPGASGSAVLSAQTHQIIGILVYQFDGDVGFAVEPISRFADFMAAPVQTHPVEEAKATDDPAIRIPDAVYQSTFGPTHTFMLAVKGPNPRFVQGGYTFVADLDGMELSDAYYYTVPVYIGEAEDGTFLLVSTNENYSVPVAVVQAPAGDKDMQ